MVIGADSGSGKSELGINIARHNAKRGKKVAMYFLEGGHTEAIARMKWRDIATKYYAHHSDEGVDMDYANWIVNYKQHPLMTKLEAEVYVEYQDEFNNNLNFYRSRASGLTLTDFHASLLSFQSLETACAAPIDDLGRRKGFDLDLIILDHINYFELTGELNEITETTKIIRAVKNITDNYKIPAVVISHFRKKNKDRGLPDQEDFYGSSNLLKISTTSIVIAPCVDKENLKEGVFPTWLRVVKSRVGIRSSYAILADFDFNKRKYADTYNLYAVSKDGYVAPDAMSSESLPRWAKAQHDRQIHG